MTSLNRGKGEESRWRIITLLKKWRDTQKIKINGSASGAIYGNVLVMVRCGSIHSSSVFEAPLNCHWEAESEQAVREYQAMDIDDMAPIQHVSEIDLFDTT